MNATQNTTFTASFVEVCRKVAAEHSLHLVRAKKGATPGTYEAKVWEGNKRGWTLLDATSANCVVKVYDALNPTNQAKIATLSAERTLDICWKMVG
jgi:hypothetical protein